MGSTLLTYCSIALIFFALFLGRKNPFALIYILITILFIYGRYIFVEFHSGYALGEAEWLFPGVGSSAIVSYQYYFLVFFTIFSLALFFLRPVPVLAIPAPKISRTFILFVSTVVLIGLYRGYLYTSIMVSGGYIAAVDYSPPWYVSAITSTFLKPLAIWFALIAASSKEKIWKYLFAVLTVVIALSWQRSDLITIVLIYFCLQYAGGGRTIFKFISSGLFILSLGYLVFYIREAGWEPNDNLVADVIWAQGISINPGLYLFDHIDSFVPMDALGFPVPYFLCGVGKVLSDVCRSDERLAYPGFLFEKTMSVIGVDTDGSFLGLGGNVVGALFVSSRLFDLYELNFVVFLVFSAAYSLMLIYFFGRPSNSVLGCLFLGCILISSRYGLNAVFPPANQMVVALVIDYIIRYKKNSTRKAEVFRCGS